MAGLREKKKLTQLNALGPRLLVTRPMKFWLILYGQFLTCLFWGGGFLFDISPKSVGNKKQHHTGPRPCAIA